jgi:hypothetical protein
MKRQRTIENPSDHQINPNMICPGQISLRLNHFSTKKLSNAETEYLMIGTMVGVAIIHLTNTRLVMTTHECLARKSIKNRTNHSDIEHLVV